MKLNNIIKNLYVPEPDKSCLNGCLLFLEDENGVIGALGRRRFRLGSFSINFLKLI